jgi:WXXGXW repeat (2 copies)
MRTFVHGLLAALLLAVLPVASQAGVFVSVTIAPPALPVYYQPPIPGPGYIWTPGYWAWDDGYYWVPGTWVLAPVGLLWTPGYWGWVDGAYVWNAGYWGPHVGFYGGIDYGFGYGGVGFVGGEWRGGQLYYNRAVTNITTTNITTVYNRTVVNNGPVRHVSFNGGADGIQARPSGAELAAAHERHVEPLPVQTEHRVMASHDNSLRASVNGGRPPIAATQRPGVFTGAARVAAVGASESRRGSESHGSANPQALRSETRGGGNPQRGNYAQNRGSNAYPQGAAPQPRNYQEPRREANAQPRGGYTQQPRANEYPQSRPGGYSQQPRPNAYPQPQAQPGGRPQQGRPEQGPAQGRGNERQQGREQQGREDHPH